MDKKSLLFLAVPPPAAMEAAASGCPLALMAYRVGQGFHLYRTPLPPCRADILYADCAGFSGRGPHNLLAAELLAECRARGYSGILLDLDSAAPPIPAFCALLREAAAEDGVTLYLPQEAARDCPGAAALVTTAISAGTLEARVRGAASAGPAAMLVESVRAEYTLPSAGNGRELSDAELRAILAQHGKSARFSPELCENYLVCSRGGAERFILWDDGASLCEKLRLARRLGVPSAFAYYPRVRDFVPALLAAAQGD